MAKPFVVAVGDSVMWGQGLARKDTFVESVQDYIGHFWTPRRSALNFARSGAPMANGFPFAGPATEPIDIKVRRRFIDTYPTLFVSAAQKSAFEHGEEIHALRLDAELPAAHPTVEAQLRNLALAEGGALGQQVGLLLVNGGPNDVDFQKLLNPEGHRWEDFHTLARETFYTRKKLVLKLARIACPNALIVECGYYSAFTSKSSSAQMKSWLKHEKSIGLVDYVVWGALTALLPPVGALIAHYADDALDDAVRDLKARSQQAYLHALHWQRRAVSELQADESVVGPGLVFAHPGFGDHDAAFASSSCLWDAYNPVNDSVAASRMASIPRAHVLGKLQGFRNGLSTHLRTPSQPLHQLVGLMKGLKELAKKLDGPTRLKDAIAAYNPPLTLQYLNEEISRILNARRASFLHPNRRGAAKYAKAVNHAINGALAPNEHGQMIALRAVAGTALRREASRAEVLRHFCLPDNLPASCLPNSLRVDAIGVNYDVSDGNEARLVLRVGRWSAELGGSVLRQGVSTWRVLTVVDVAGAFTLADLARGIEIFPVNGKTSVLGDIVVTVNGRDVYRDLGRRTRVHPRRVSEKNPVAVQLQDWDRPG